MIINQRDLNVNNFYLNPTYVDKALTFSTHIIDVKESINYLDTSKRELSLHINVVFKSKKDNDIVVTGEFIALFDIILNGDETENSPEYFIPFHKLINDAFLNVHKHLLKNIPVDMIEITPPLIMAYEIEELATSIYEKLIKHPF